MGFGNFRVYMLVDTLLEFIIFKFVIGIYTTFLCNIKISFSVSSFLVLLLI